MKFQAALFDLGGTLLDFNPEKYPWLEWERIGVQKAHDYLRSRGYEMSLDAFAGYFMGQLAQRWEMAVEGRQNLQLGDFLHESCRVCGADPLNDEIQEALGYYIAPLDARVVMYDDAVETLARLRDRGFKIALVSNTMWPGVYHRGELERFGLMSYFDCALFSGDSGLWKPQPEIYHLALAQLGVSAENAFFVGDTPQHDLIGARAVGMYTVFRRNKVFPLDGFRPDAEIDRLSELIEIVEGVG